MNTKSSCFITGSDNQKSMTWKMPSVGQDIDKYGNRTQDRDNMRSQSYDDAYQKGYAAGEMAVQQLQMSLVQMLQTMQQPAQLVDAEIQQNILQLVIAITQNILGETLKQAPERIAKIIEQACKHLPLIEEGFTLEISPQDETTLRENNLLQEFTPNKIVSKPELKPGECRVHNHYSCVDASIHACIENLMHASKQVES